MAHPALPESVAAQSLIATIGGRSPSPEAQARSLVFAWLVSLPAEADPCDAAAALARHLEAEAEPDNALLPHLLSQLAAVRNHSKKKRLLS